MLWGDTRRRAASSSELQAIAKSHLEIGKLGDLEGAAGSIYMSMPVTFYGKDRQASSAAADVILRRVNDVPGSTAAQRRWHIERIDWKEA